jgi:PAS domain S-box-containing protein
VAPGGFAARVLDHIGAAVMVTSVEGTIIHWNRQAEELYGWTQDEAVGANLIELSMATHEVPAAREITTRLARGLAWQGELPIRRKDGSGLLAYVIDAPLFDDRGELTGMVGVAVDVTARHNADAERAILLGREKAVRVEAEEARARAERVADRVARLQLVTASLSEATTPDRVTRVVARQGVAALGASAGVVALLAGTGSTIEVIASVSSDDARLVPGDRLPLNAAHPLADAIRTGEPVWIGSVAELAERYPGLAVSAATKALAAVPLMMNGRVLGGLGIGFDEPHEFGPDEQTFTLTLAQYCAQALDRSRLLQREQAAQRRLAFLAEASEILGSSLDYRASLTKVADVAVVQVAEWCTIHVVDEATATLEQVAATHADRDGRSVPSPDKDESAAITVPLVARGQNLGTISMGMALPRGNGRRSEVSDIGLVEDLARRAATAIDLSRLYDERSQVARKLQESLLPPSLPEIPGLQVAVRYRAAGEGTEVGGDFYDVFPTGDGSWAAVIGDVCGKGADAAGVTGLARHTIRAVAMQERSPAIILDRLNQALLNDETDRFCTVCVVRFEPPASGRAAKLTIASAGHPLPLVITGDGPVEAHGVPSMPAGLFSDALASEARVELQPGEAVVLYTDGVTERRGGTVMFGEDRLRALLGRLAGSDAGCIAARVEDEVVHFQPEPLRDDMAVLVLRMAPA